MHLAETARSVSLLLWYLAYFYFIIASMYYIDIMILEQLFYL